MIRLQPDCPHLSVITYTLLLLLIALPVSAADDILYINRESGTVVGELGVDSDDGIICGTCSSIVRIDVDNRRIESVVTVSGEGAGSVSGSFQNLKEGRHQAFEEVYGPDGKPIDANSRLFILDTTPPELNLISPLEKKLTAFGITFIVSCTDDGAGIEYSDKFIDVRLNGQPARWSSAKHAGRDALVIDRGEGKGPWGSGESVTLSVTVKDRAENKADRSWSFSVLPSPPGEEIGIVATTCYKPDTNQLITYTGNHLSRFRFPYNRSLTAIVFTLQSMEATAEFGTENLDISGLDAIEQSPGMFENRPVGANIMASVTLASDSPRLTVERIKIDETLVRFRVIQTEPAPRDEMVVTLTMQHPEFVDWPRRYECSKTGEPLAIAEKMQPAGTVVSHVIPVILAAEKGNIDQKVYSEGAKIYCLLEDTTNGGIALTASYFEVEGMKYWFDQQSEHSCIAEAPVEEGLIPYRTVLRTATTWIPSGNSRGSLTDNERDWITDGTVTVTLDPPAIRSFTYDEHREILTADISDIGTPLEELTITLSVSEAGDLYAAIDPLSGRIYVPYSLPYGIQNATLSVTDNAGQNTTAGCRIFGRVPENENLQGHITSLTDRNPDPASLKTGVPFRHGQDEITLLSGYSSTGIHKATVCTERHTYRQIQTTQLNECIARGLAKNSTGHYDQRSLEQCINDLKLENSFNRNATEKNPPSATRYTGLYVSTIDCEKEDIDLLAPRIRAVAYHPGSGLVTARIDDWGNDPKKIATRFSVGNRRPSEPDWYFWNTNSSVSHRYSPASEQFSGYFDDTDEKYEEFRVTIVATDTALNSNSASLDIIIPRKPPEVITMQTETSGDITQIRVSCQDNTGIDHNRTIMTINGQPLAYMQLMENFSRSLGRPSAEYTYTYGTVLEEGIHLAHIRVFDFSSLSAEKSLEFTITNKPEIHRFEALPYEMQRTGGPAFYAFITDNGNDLVKEGIELRINGNTVDPDRAFYDASNGYYNMDGPVSDLFSTAGKINIAKLKATDSHNNTAEKTIHFTWNVENTVIIPDPETGDLHLEEVTIWETVTRNGNGLLNAGESARIFTKLSSQIPIAVVGLKGLLVSIQDTINIESGEVLLGDLVPGEKLNPLKGFDIRISPDFFRSIPEDRRDVDFFLELEDKNDSSWRLPLRLTVYRQEMEAQTTSGPAATSVVTVTLNNTPATTEDTQITIIGRATSSLYDVAHLTLTVNGAPVTATLAPDGSFSADVPLTVGHNFIEAEAQDTSGVTGWASRTVIRTEPALPPEIEILSPVNGSRYECDFNSYNFIDVAGVFAPNHSTYTITIRVERRETGVEVINTVIPPSGISGNNFNHRIFLNDLGTDWSWEEICGFLYDVEVRIETPAGSDNSITAFDVRAAS